MMSTVSPGERNISGAGKDLPAIDAAAVLEALPDPFFAVDPSWQVIYLNRAAERIWGLRREDVLGRPLNGVFPPFEGSEAQAAMQRVLRTGGPERVEVLCRFVDLPLELDISRMPWGLGVHFRDISPRRAIQRRLEERDALLTLAEDSAGVGVWEIDVAADTVRGTPQFFRLMGLPPTAEPIPMDRIRQLRFPEDRSRLWDNYQEMRRTGGTYELEHRIRRPDGEERWILGRGRMVFDAAGTPVRLSGMDVDITARKRSEAALRESEDRFRQVFEQSPLGKATLGPDFRLREVNPALCRMLGYVQDELVGRNLLDIVHPEDRATCYERGAAMLTGREPQLQLEERFLRKSGEPFWVSITVGAIRAADGSVLYTLGIIEDIDERRRIRLALEESERRLRELNEQLEQAAEQRARQLASSRAQLQAFFDNSPDWLTLQRVLPDGRIEYADLNPTCEAAYGMTREQVIGNTVEEVLGLEGSREPLRLLRECVRTGETQRYVARRTMSGRSRTIDVMFVLVPGVDESGNRYIITTARDLTDREQLEAQLRQAQKMEAIGQLTGGVAHDFNNLLAVVMGSADLAKRRPANAPALMDNILRAGERGVALTRQLLSFSRRQPAESRVIDLRSEMPRILAMLRPSLRGDIVVESAVADDLWLIETDPNELEIALLNIAVNARDAMPNGGTFSITVSNAVAAQPSGTDSVTIVLRDTGEGVAPDLLGKVFDPFFTTKEPGSGTGLGLSQVYGFAQQSGGCVGISSRLGVGTTITLYLPRSDKVLANAEIGRTAIEPRAAGRRVLLVEDNPDVAQVVSEMLRSMELEVEQVDRARHALERLELQAFDVLLTDVVMPDGLNGLELARQVRTRFPDMPILLTSGYNEILPHDAGEFRLLRKPVPYMELRDAINACLPLPSAGAAGGEPAVPA